MKLYEQIESDIRAAMKKGNKETLSVLRMFKAAIQMAKANQQDKSSDEEVIKILRSQIKTKESSVIEYESYDRLDIADGLRSEIKILKAYLPEELSDVEVEKILNEAMTEVKPEGIKDMGKIMKIMTEKISGRYDMAKISNMVKEQLN